MTAKTLTKESEVLVALSGRTVTSVTQRRVGGQLIGLILAFGDQTKVTLDVSSASGGTLVARSVDVRSWTMWRVEGTLHGGKVPVSMSFSTQVGADASVAALH